MGDDKKTKFLNELMNFDNSPIDNDPNKIY